ncbi:hypothetical protein [Sorangium sp. So ce861]|uniref:hypothetical protein n=1 Tax=Sorangium sp. So ce861 TaxID=3133323 RepID=UPI003F61813F
MASYGVPVAALFGACVLSLGCVGMPVDDGQAEDEVLTAEQAAKAAVPTSNYVYMNGSSPKFFWNPSTIKELKRLAKVPLTTPTGQLTDTWLTDSQDGLSLLGHVIGCSLPSTTAVDAEGLKFEGAAGLAAEWAKGPLSAQASQRWVTACLLQTLNGFNVQVPIRMTGAHPGLDDTTSDIQDYPIADGTMFGNIFFSDIVEAYACADVDAVNECGDAWSTNSAKRICDVPTCDPEVPGGQCTSSCGITLLGPCAGTCTVSNEDPTCTSPPSALFPKGKVYAEAIAVKLNADGFTDLNPLCLEE